MKSVTALPLLLAGAASAQTIQSKPFELVIQSANETLNGQQFTACHSGAAIESLCLNGNPGSHYYLNTTEGVKSPQSGVSAPGVIVWNLPIGNEAPEPEAMSFYTEPGTNVAMPMFYPSYGEVQVVFDSKDQMGIYSTLDDTVTPPSDNSKGKVLKNWYLCDTVFSGYQYRTLSWVNGNGSEKPQNPSCVHVEVERKFV
ncbi:hypothetical protein N7468_003515 [Penicillium chermesinum]|uniref:DUF7907 domain-containing protein n=1 Tax=Penicillium chermesinum TaxID=63820 RepID=A0A9W9TRN8_9EURO|nr:uncharacterized protein N7468_003515 [Penicillium chermesinum]KAJ5238896.1 hypothetical protein N7468_003515 [Penicillium chermesinum]KAJ6164534.1 hypothetical protein N7470_003206 [Penicillium chermesinum]